MIRLHNQDCMQAMEAAPDDHWDLAIVDPPYCIGRSGQKETFTKQKKHKRKYFPNKNWDNQTPSKNYFDLLKRVSKNQIIWGGNYFPQFLNKSMGWIVWDKMQSLSMSDGELAYTSFEKALRIIRMNRCQLALEGTIHPTQKPIKLYEILLSMHAKKGDKILDTHLGSGSSAIAAHRMGFEFDGYEIDRDYFEGAQNRLKEDQKQLLLFGSR